MANEYAVNSADLTSVADAIREKGGTEDALSFPAEFVTAIQNIKAGGGAPFQLIAVSSEDSLPETARENTVAVVTEQAVGTLYVYPETPDAAIVGDVLILDTGIGKIINLTEDGTFAFRGAGVYIKNDDAWAFVDAYIFVNNEWQCLWANRLYYEGDEYTVHTGGFVAHEISSRNGASATVVLPDVTRNADNIFVDTKSTDSRGVGMFCTANMIDLTPYSSLVFEGTFTSEYTSYPQNFVAAAWSKIPDFYTNDRLAYYQMSSSSRTQITIDVSSINESAYIGFGLAYATVKLERCYLVPKEIE